MISSQVYLFKRGTFWAILCTSPHFHKITRGTRPFSMYYTNCNQSKPNIIGLEINCKFLTKTWEHFISCVENRKLWTLKLKCHVRFKMQLYFKSNRISFVIVLLQLFWKGRTCIVPNYTIGYSLSTLEAWKCRICSPAELRNCES